MSDLLYAFARILDFDQEKTQRLVMEDFYGIPAPKYTPPVDEETRDA